MSRIEKLVKKLKDRPQTLQWSEVMAILDYYGFACVNIRGSHYTFYNAIHRVEITVVKQHRKDSSINRWDAKKIAVIIDNLQQEK